MLAAATCDVIVAEAAVEEAQVVRDGDDETEGVKDSS